MHTHQKFTMNGNNKIDRLSQGGKREETSFCSLLDEASNVARRVLESIQAIAGTTACKGVQIHGLEKFAVRNGYLISRMDDYGSFADRGSENEVYTSFDNNYVFKLNDFRYSDDNLDSFFERISAHNALFPDCAYECVGFAYNQNRKFCAVLKQPFIHAEREATEEEITHKLTKLGFAPQFDGEYFSNGQYDIFDALPNNVLKGSDGNLYFIDTIIYRTDSQNLATYKSLSPRYSKE